LRSASDASSLAICWYCSSNFSWRCASKSFMFHPPHIRGRGDCFRNQGKYRFLTPEAHKNCAPLIRLTPLGP
jgi:hypothetical protein